MRWGRIPGVGYEGTVSLEYRGTTDPIDALHATRALIEHVTEASSS